MVMITIQEELPSGDCAMQVLEGEHVMHFDDVGNPVGFRVVADFAASRGRLLSERYDRKGHQRKFELAGTFSEVIRDAFIAALLGG